MGMKSAEVNGTKSKSLRTKRTKSPTDSKRAEYGFFTYSAPHFLYGSLDDDFAAAVDFRGSRAAITDPKNANSEVRRPSDKDTEKIAGKK